MNVLKEVKDDFQAFLVNSAQFTNAENYPIIEEWMIPEVFPEKIVPFNKINKIKNIEDYYICFYCRDVDFKRIIRNPRKYIKMFQRSKGIIGLDYSVYIDMPKIVQKKQMYNNLALSYFYGNHGIKVIPNIRYGLEELSNEFLESIPKNQLIAVGTYGFIKTIIEQNNWFNNLLKIIEILDPSGIVIYGTLPKDIQRWLKLYNVKYKIYDSFHSIEMKEVRKNVNKGEE